MILNSAFVLREIYHVFLLVPIKRNEISKEVISLNSTAALILKKCRETDSVEKLAELVADEFVDIPREEIIDTLVPYINSLVRHKLIIKEAE